MSVALVTGAGAGIGRAVCAALAADGWDVVLNDVDGARAERAAADLASAGGGRVLAAPGDVADAAAVDGMVERALDELGGLDAAVANAGITTFAPFLEMPRAELDRLLAVNLAGTWATAQAAARAMAARGGGRIVLLSSVVALRAMPGLAAYGMTKAAIAGLAGTARRRARPGRHRRQRRRPGRDRDGADAAGAPTLRRRLGRRRSHRTGVVSRGRRRARALPAQPERVAADGSDVGRGRGLERPLARSSWVLIGPAYQRQTTRAASATTAPTMASRM